MAAETLTHRQFRRLLPTQLPGPNPSRKIIITAGFGEVGDIHRVAILGRGEKLGANFAVQMPQVDTHATPTHTFNLRAFKTGETPLILIHESTVGQTGGIARSSKVNATENGVGAIIPEEGYELQLICVAAAATQAAGPATAVVCMDLCSYRDTGEITE